MPVGEAFLSAFLQVLFDRLASKHVLDFVRGHDIENDLKRLKRTLKKVNAVLNDAEDKQFKDDEVKMWLDELKDAAYDAEDVLDDFATEALRQKLEAESDQTISNQVLSLIPAPLNFSVRWFNNEIESKIKAIVERFDELANERFELGLTELAARSSSIVRETSSVVDESRVYGRDDDKNKITELLLKDDLGCDDKISVIPIVGMGGVGKTTLAQIVYNDNKVKGHFDLKAWVCVSEDFDVKRITKSILQSVTSSKTPDSGDLDHVQVKLAEALTEKKFLIVLDDVWSKDYDDWDVLQNPFKVGAPGSRIIITTRLRDVALMMGTVDRHDLEHLSNDDCWSVFVRHAFVNINIDTKPKLAVIGKKIVEKCEGLPLAAKTLGGLLRNKLEEDEWEDILNSKIWHLPEQGNKILPALRLSYYYLPSHLKRCFAYCSILPKDYEFTEMELVQLWVAEGLVRQPDRKKQMEDVGVGYFNDLRSMSFFQVSSSNKSLFVMHNLINDLAQQVAGEICFRLEDKLEGKEECRISRKARHSSYVGSQFDGVKKFEAFKGLECLRTFLPLMTPERSYLTNYVPLNLLPELRCLRVLSLRGYRIIELPNSIGDLKHLRFLNLSDTEIISLPEATSTLYNLQALLLTNCNCLKKLPAKMRNLFNLRHLDITGVHSVKEMPLGIGMLTSLQTLYNFVVDKGSGSRIRELRNLRHIQRLGISKLENVIDASNAREASLNDKQDLKVLVLEWSIQFDGSRNESVEKEVLDMFHPHKKLEELTIKFYGGTRLPTWIGDPSFSRMVLVRLENCVKCTSLPPLGQLPLLKDLCIEGMNGVNTVDVEFNGKGCPKPFPSLESLTFEDMQEWIDWFPSAVDGKVEAFPCLRELSIKRCPKLSGKLPDRLPSLEKLIIVRCQRLVVSISSFPKLCNFEIEECEEIVQRDTVDLSSLKTLVLSNIPKLMSLTEGFQQGLTNVEELNIAGCSELTSLWQNEEGLLQHLTSLHRLTIEGCPKFVSLVAEEVEQQQQLEVPCRLKSLKLRGCDNLEKLQDLHSLTTLINLSIFECPRLVSFLERGCDALKSPPRTMMHRSEYRFLKYLKIEGCDSVTSIARGQLPSTLKRLVIKHCNNLQSLLDEEEGSSSSSSSSSSPTMDKSNNSGASHLEYLYISVCPSLKPLSSRAELPATLNYLHVDGCPKLESVAERLHNNTSLESFSIRKCESLKSLPKGLHNLSCLSKFVIRKCPILVSFPDGGLPATNLRELWIYHCEKLEALPDRMHDLTSLQHLRISDCAGIVSFPEEGFPTNLTLLSIIDLKICKPLLEWGLHRLNSLRELRIINGCQDLVSFPEEEMGMILPTSLTRLIIRKFRNLEYLSSNGFQNLTSLEVLSISKCPKLKSLPEEGLPPSLLQLRIKECPLLKQQCKKYQGRDWPKIAHIPCVMIDDRFIYDPEHKEE